MPPRIIPSATSSLVGLFAGVFAALVPLSPISDPSFHPQTPGRAPVRKSATAETDVPAHPRLVRTYATLYNLHTKELAVLTDSSPSQEQFSRFLRDRVTGQTIPMAPRLLQLLRTLTASSPRPLRIEFVSGYRSWKFNEHLRKKGHHVASHSQHSLGHAMDLRIGTLSAKALANQIERLHWRGGLAYYPDATDRFVHVDVGPNRRWKGR